MKVLIVDDNQDILDLFKDLMGGLYTVITAKNGQEALNIKDGDKDISVVLTDIQMPVMDGFELCQKIRKSDPLSIIIGFTAKYGISTAFQARDAGFDDIFTKPIDPDEMINLVGQAFQRVKRWTGK